MIRVQDLHRSYGDHAAVSGVSFEIERGEIVGFLGPNGAGKSTTMRILAGISNADRGRVTIAGLELPEQSLEARAALGYLPEHTPLYASMRVDRFLEFAARARGLRGKRERTAAISVAMDRAGLEGFERHRVSELSKGYKQRVGLAQAMVGEPDVLLLDEPTSGLDPLEGRRLRERIAEYAAERTVLLSTHVLPEVEALCHRALMLVAGRLVADGKVAELTGCQATVAGSNWSVELVAEASSEHPLPDAATLSGLSGVRSAESSGTAPGRFRVVAEDSERFTLELNRLCRSRHLLLLELAREHRSLESVFAERAANAALGSAPSSEVSR